MRTGDPREPALEREVRERLDEESPDGRPPSPRARRGAEAVFITGLSVVFIAVIASLYAWGGPIPALVALVLIGTFVGLAAWPAWHAAMDRRRDRARAEGEVIHEHRAAAHPPGR